MTKDDLPELESFSEDEFNSLHYAIISNDPKKINFVLDLRPEYLDCLIYINDSLKKRSAIGFAVDAEKEISFKHLLSLKTKLNYEDLDVWGPLNIAVMAANYEAVRLLIKAGASVKIADSDPKYPIIRSALFSYSGKELIKLLIDNGATLDTTLHKWSYVATSIYMQYYTDYFDVFQLLVNSGAPLKGTVEYPDIIEFTKKLHNKKSLKNFDRIITTLKAAKAKRGE